MIKILKAGCVVKDEDRKFIATCEKCNCQFTFLKKDGKCRSKTNPAREYPAIECPQEGCDHIIVQQFWDEF